jgi:hypothetical protein
VRGAERRSGRRRHQSFDERTRAARQLLQLASHVTQAVGEARVEEGVQRFGHSMVRERHGSIVEGAAGVIAEAQWSPDGCPGPIERLRAPTRAIESIRTPPAAEMGALKPLGGLHACDFPLRSS